MEARGAVAAPTLTIWLAGHPPTPNQRMNHWDRYRATQEWKQAAYYAALEQRPYPQLASAWLECLFVYHTHRRRDFDNLVASLKGAIDGLVLAKALTDDTIDVLRSISIRTKIDPLTSEGVELSVVPDRL
jgi:Holliday junction resolvase RusA-like endonuclease